MQVSHKSRSINLAEGVQYKVILIYPRFLATALDKSTRYAKFRNHTPHGTQLGPNRAISNLLNASETCSRENKLCGHRLFHNIGKVNLILVERNAKSVSELVLSNVGSQVILNPLMQAVAFIES